VNNPQEEVKNYQTLKCCDMEEFFFGLILRKCTQRGILSLTSIPSFRFL